MEKPQERKSPIVIFLAAGTGKRLWPVTDEKPKALIEIAGETLLQRLSKQFEKQGIKDFLAVGGHYYTKLLDHIDQLYPTTQKTINFSCVYNGCYQDSNNAKSLSVGLTYLACPAGRDIYIVNTDIVIFDSVLTPLISSTKSTLLVDNKRDLTLESMKVYTWGKRLTTINKKIDRLQSSGEYIGIAKIVADDIYKLKIALDAVVQIDVDMFYEDALQLLCHWTEVEVLWTDGVPWTEIDTHEDLKVAKTLL